MARPEEPWCSGLTAELQLGSQSMASTPRKRGLVAPKKALQGLRANLSQIVSWDETQSLQHPMSRSSCSHLDPCKPGVPFPGGEGVLDALEVAWHAMVLERLAVCVRLWV